MSPTRNTVDSEEKWQGTTRRARLTPLPLTPSFGPAIQVFIIKTGHAPQKHYKKHVHFLPVNIYVTLAGEGKYKKAIYSK